MEEKDGALIEDFVAKSSAVYDALGALKALMQTDGYKDLIERMEELESDETLPNELYKKLGWLSGDYDEFVRDLR